MRKLGIALGLAWLACIAPTVRAEDKPAAAPPPVTDIIAKYVTALGGREALLKVTNRVINASVEIKGMNTTFDVQLLSAAPNKKLSIFSPPGEGKITEGFDGETAWVQLPNMPATEKPSNQLADVRIDADFYKEIHLSSTYPQIVYKARVDVNSKPAHQIVATPKEGKSVTLYFDVESGLLVRLDTEAETPLGKAEQQIYFDDYKTMDGIRIPQTVRQIVPDSVSTILRLKEVKQNTNLDPNQFKKPSS